jgi:hypothetical protein
MADGRSYTLCFGDRNHNKHRNVAPRKLQERSKLDICGHLLWFSATLLEIVELSVQDMVIRKLFIVHD